MIELNAKFVEANTVIATKAGAIAVTPPLDGDYYIARVPLYKDQAIVVFPKFFTIGCGFQLEEEDWNTNLPLQTDAEEIYNHIKKNKHYREISKGQCVAAIKELQNWAKENLTPDGKPK